jgi:hypothetical protein
MNVGRDGAVEVARSLFVGSRQYSGLLMKVERAKVILGRHEAGVNVSGSLARLECPYIMDG